MTFFAQNSWLTSFLLFLKLSGEDSASHLMDESLLGFDSEAKTILYLCSEAKSTLYLCSDGQFSFECIFSTSTLH